jgi:hypothetical protein
MYLPFVGTGVSLENYLNLESCNTTTLVTSYYYTIYITGDTFLRRLCGKRFFRKRDELAFSYLIKGGEV